MRLFSIIFTVLTISITSMALELGEVSIGGTGCFGTSRLIKLNGTEGSYVAPLRVRLNKTSTAAFERKSCQIRIPVKLNANEKLQISDVSQSVRMLLNKNVAAQTSLEVSVVGQRVEALKSVATASDRNQTITDVVKNQGLVVESACGKDTIITGNLNALVTGEAKAFVSTGSLNLKINVVSCE